MAYILRVTKVSSVRVKDIVVISSTPSLFGEKGFGAVDIFSMAGGVLSAMALASSLDAAS